MFMFETEVAGARKLRGAGFALYVADGKPEVALTSLDVIVF